MLMPSIACALTASVAASDKSDSAGRFSMPSNDISDGRLALIEPIVAFNCADAFADSVAPAIREAQAAGAKTLRQIAAALNGRGIGTARGGKWEAATVANVLRRIG